MADELALSFTVPDHEADVTGKGTRLLMFGMRRPGTGCVTITGQAKAGIREAILRYADELRSA